MNTVNKQAGLSMVELLIALAISSFLILGVTQIYIDNKTSYLFQQGQAQNQENGRFSLMVLEQHLAKAGFRRRPDDSLEQAFTAGTFNTTTGAGTCTFRAGQAVTKVDDSTICLRFEPRDATEVDCAGTGVTTPADFATHSRLACGAGCGPPVPAATPCTHTCQHTCTMCVSCMYMTCK